MSSLYLDLLYKRTILRSLRNLQLLSINKTTRFTTCCKLLYCRDSDTSRSPPNSHIPPIFELFVVDSSLQTAGTFTGDSQTSPYVRIIAHSSYVMSSQLKDVLNCPGAILSLTGLLCSVEGTTQCNVSSMRYHHHHHHHCRHHGRLSRASRLDIQSWRLIVHAESSAEVVASVSSLRVSIKVVVRLPGSRQPDG